MDRVFDLPGGADERVERPAGQAVEDLGEQDPGGGVEPEREDPQHEDRQRAGL